MSRCSIVIPVFNHAALTARCLDALLANPPEQTTWEIVVVNDGSSDRTPEILDSYGDRIRVVRHPLNQGYATACNDGARAAVGEYLVFLNNDTIPLPGWLDALVRYAEAHPVAIVGSKLMFADDTIQHAGVVICQDRLPRHIYAGFPADHPAVQKSRRFKAVTAACVLVRRSVFEALGGFDASFHNGFEDIDFCLRAGELGYEAHYCHESVLYHHEAASRADQGAEDLQNRRLYEQRWAQRVQPDELQYYVEDGLLRVDYSEVGQVYPITLTVSPLLARVEGSGNQDELSRLLATRARQVYLLLKENLQLRQAGNRRPGAAGDQS